MQRRRMTRFQSAFRRRGRAEQTLSLDLQTHDDARVEKAEESKNNLNRVLPPVFEFVQCVVAVHFFPVEESLIRACMRASG